MTAREPLDSDRWERLERLFHEASALPLEEVAAFLERACEGDDTLRAHVTRLLEADTAPNALVDGDVVELADPLLEREARAPEPELTAGSRVGRFEVLDLLGRGGMGTVYRAARADGAYEQEVALKVVRSGRIEEGARRRFVRERDILARLVHPSIATLLDGGVDDAGRPFLAMELVDGLPITEYAETRGLDVRARVALAVQVAEGVDHAHRNLVVHRDLKPSNILVTRDGSVKLLDFGIARLLAEDADGDAHTRTGHLLLTPAYAAPEQIRGAAVTTAVDVFAIGAVLYELLAGRRPHGDVGGSWSEVQRVLDTEPPPPSRVDGLDRALRRAFEGDLDTIVLKAMQKDPERRYGSARALAEDLERYLRGLAVEARPDSWGYRFSKLVRRNVAASAATIALLGALALGVGGTAWQARAAQLEAERKDAVADFMTSVFRGADPEATPGEPVTALELLESALVRVDALEAGAEVRVDLLVTLGDLFGTLGHYERAEPVLRQAVLEAEESLGRRDPARANAYDALGQHVSEVGEVRESEELFRAALASRDVDGSSAEAIAATRSNLALSLRKLGETVEAAVLYEAVMAETLASNGGDSLAIVSDLLGLGQVRQWDEEYEVAIRLFAEARRVKEAAGQRDAQLAHVIHASGVVHGALERNEEAEALHLEALSIWQWLYPEGHPEVAG
ncbi:MAG: serine/threonine-protein kinase [Gemmatimonadota bacterium]